MHVIPKRQSYACRVCANVHVIVKRELEIEHHRSTRMKELMSKVRISRRLCFRNKLKLPIGVRIVPCHFC